MLHTTFLPPLFERSSKDLQMAEPSVLPPSSTTTDHHRTSGPISAAHSVWVLNHSWYRAARLQETGLNSIPGYRQNLRRDLVGLSRSFCLHFSKASPGSFFVRRGSHLELARRGGHFLPDPCALPAHQITSPEVFLCWLPLGLRFSRSTPAREGLKPNFHSVESNFSRRRRDESFQETRPRERGPTKGAPAPPSPRWTPLNANTGCHKGRRPFSASRAL